MCVHTSIDFSNAMMANGRKKKLKNSPIMASPKWSLGGGGLPLAVGIAPSAAAGGWGSHMYTIWLPEGWRDNKPTPQLPHTQRTHIYRINT